jgi:hypothetical protein
MVMGALRRRPLVVGTILQAVLYPDSLDHQHAILDLDITLAFGDESPLAPFDPARLQRASQCSG